VVHLFQSVGRRSETRPLISNFLIVTLSLNGDWGASANPGSVPATKKNASGPGMTSAERYRAKAAMFTAMAEDTATSELKATYMRMAQGYLRLADHAQKRNDIHGLPAGGPAR
jgi:hypothetical protein